MAFLGGKYLQPEQVITGNVQTFRAREAATGRSVFVHRIAETSQPQQAALLKLLLSCLYRSSAVKELVLDVREEGEFCFVVTESVPQCLLLREWLQFESDRPDPGTKPAGGEATLRGSSEGPPGPRLPVPAAPQRPEPHLAVSQPSPPPQARSEPGEFTRMFQAVDPSKVETVSQKMPAPAHSPVRQVTPMPPESGRAHSRPESPEKPQTEAPAPAAPAPPGEFTRLFQTPLQTPPTQAPHASKDAAVSTSTAATIQPSSSVQTTQARDPGMHGAPGEFTRLFQTPAKRPLSEPQSPQPAPPQPAVPSPKPEPGEFTRFFGGGSPALTPEGSSFPAVQRPSSSQNVAAPSPAPGEFTRLFSSQSSRPVAPATTAPPYQTASTPVESFRPPNPAGASGTAGEFTRIFGGGTERASSPGAANSAGEYTQLFGTNDPAPVPVFSQPAVAADPNVAPLNEPGPSIQPPRPIPQGPSEFTRVVMGSGASPVEPIPAAAPLPSAPPANAMPGMRVPAAPAIPAAPHPPVPHVPAVPAVPAASAPAPRLANKPNKALLLLFLILFVPAAVLVIVIAVEAKH